MTDKADALPQLKKNSFLAHVPEVPTTLKEMTDLLDGYEFIGSYLAFLVDHFVGQGKVVKDADGRFYRKGKGGTGASGAHRVAYRVVADEGAIVSEDGVTMEVTYTMTERNLEVGEQPNKEIGEGLTPGKAAKNAKSFIFQKYLRDGRAVTDLAEGYSAGAPVAATHDGSEVSHDSQDAVEDVDPTDPVLGEDEVDYSEPENYVDEEEVEHGPDEE